MPIFMDRHDIQKPTAEDVAAAHQADLKVQAHYGAKALTYWFDEQRETAFCLIDAPTADAVRELHREAHGQVPNEVIEVDASMVLRFLGRVTDPEVLAGKPIREPGFRAIMFTDMVNSTQITNSLGDASALDVLTKHNEIIRQALLAHDGREVDRAGDGFLTSFVSVSQAIACAVAIQKAFQNYNMGREGSVEIQVRIGLGAGEPLTNGGALFGSVINLTARICASAGPGQILAAHGIPELYAGEFFTFRRHGEFSLKGFSDPVELYELEWTS